MTQLQKFSNKYNIPIDQPRTINARINALELKLERYNNELNNCNEHFEKRNRTRY